MKPGKEYRRHARRPLEVEIQVGDASMGGELRFDSHDVSEGGIFLRSDLLLEVGEVMWISFVLPGAAFAIRTRGRVVWVHRNPDENDPTDTAGMGIEFMDLNDAERAALSIHLGEEESS